MKPSTLLRLYPRAWRERYGEELVALLEQRPLSPRIVANIAASAMKQRLFTFGVAPLLAALVFTLFELFLAALLVASVHPIGELVNAMFFSNGLSLAMLGTYFTSRTGGLWGGAFGVWLIVLAYAVIPLLPVTVLLSRVRIRNASIFSAVTGAIGAYLIARLLLGGLTLVVVCVVGPVLHARLARRLDSQWPETATV